MRKFVFCFVLLSFILTVNTNLSAIEVEAPTSKFLFKKDSKEYKKTKDKKDTYI